MDWSQGPAVLGGIMLSVALGAWSLGRWQAGTAAARAPRAYIGERAAAFASAPAPQTAGQCATSAGNLTDTVPTDRLGEMHEEIAAYRRAERALAAFENIDLPEHGEPGRPGPDWRRFGMADAPPCGSGTAAFASDGSAVLYAAQPSAAGEGTRV